MNRLTSVGVALEVAERRHIIVVTHQIEIGETLGNVRRFLGDDLISKVYLANGREELLARDGGRLTFASSAASLRGRTANVVFLDVDFAHDDDLVTEALIVVTPTAGEVIRA